MELPCQPEADMDPDIKRDLLILIGLAIIMKVIIILITFISHSFIDYWDMSYYFESAVRVMQGGQLPYRDFSFDYPVLAWIPILTAYMIIPSLPGFFFAFEFFMVIFDMLTIIGIYLIAMQVWGSKRRAFAAGALYALCLTAAYFTLVRFDPMPVCIMIWAVWLTLRGKAVEGYMATLVGFLVKIFPIILLPFLVLWNAKGGSLKKEVMHAGLLSACLIPLVIFFGSVTGRVGSGATVYANTPAFLLHMYTENIMHLSVTVNQISVLLYVLAGMAFLALFWFFVKARKSPVMLLTTLLLAIFIVVFVARLHSPQYVMWYLPFLCLLVSDDIHLMIILYFTQVLAFFEFPIFFGKLYTNAQYLSQVGSGVWIITVLFFTLEYLVMLCLLIMIIRKNQPSFQ